MALPSMHLHEPLLPAESIHTLFSHFKEVLTTIKPSTSASDGGASDAAAVDDEVMELDIRVTVERSSLIDQAEGGSGLGGSGVEMRLGAFKLNMGVRPAPESRSQLGLITAGEDGEAKEGATLTRVQSRPLLSSPLACLNRLNGPHKQGARIPPPAALHFTIELREDGNKPLPSRSHSQTTIQHACVLIRHALSGFRPLSNVCSRSTGVIMVTDKERQSSQYGCQLCA